MSQARLLTGPVMAAAVAVIGAFGPWHSTFAVDMVPLPSLQIFPTLVEVPWAGGWWIQAAAVLTLVLLLINRDRQWALVPALLVSAFVGACALPVINLAGQLDASLDWGLMLTFYGVVATQIAIMWHLMRQEPA